MLLALLQTAIVNGQASLIGPYLVSGSGLLSGAVALSKVSFMAGQFKEFKDSMIKRDTERKSEDTEIVKRHEMDTLGRHIDRRLDDISEQIKELRNHKLGSVNG